MHAHRQLCYRESRVCIVMYVCMWTKFWYETQQKLVTRLVSDVVKNLFYLHAIYTRPTPACPPACLEPHVSASVPTSVCLGSKDRTFYLDVVQNIGLYLGQEVVKVDCRVIILILKSPLPRYFSLHAWNFLLCCTHLCLPYLLFNLSCTGYVMLITPNVLPI